MQEFAIKKETLTDGTVILTPVTRVRSRLFPNKWERITKVEDKYILQDLDWNPVLTYEECNERIDYYKEFIRKKIQNTVKSVTYDTLEKHQAGTVVEVHDGQ